MAASCGEQLWCVGAIKAEGVVISDDDHLADRGVIWRGFGDVLSEDLQICHPEDAFYNNVNENLYP